MIAAGSQSGRRLPGTARRRRRLAEVGETGLVEARQRSSTSSMPTASARARAAPSSAGGRRRRRGRRRIFDFGGAAGEQHALDDGGALVEHRRVGGVEAGEVGDHGLEVDERLEAALRDLGLVGRVRRVPARVLEHVALDDRRRDRVVVAEADHRAAHGVLVGEGAQLGERLALGGGRGDDRGQVARRPRSSRDRAPTSASTES